MNYFAVAPADFKRLESYLPQGLASPASDNPIDRAAGYLAQLVLSHRLIPGQKVPMDEIAERIGVSRTPVREALRLLETERWVASLPNRGFVMRRMDAEEVTNLYEARGCIESFVARAALERSSKPFLQELRALHRIYADLLRGNGDRRRLGIVVDKAFHVRIAEQAGNPELTAVLANMFDRLILTRPIEDFPLNRMAEAVAEHAALLAAFERGSGRRVDAAMRRNVTAGATAILAHMQRPRDFDFPRRASNDTKEQT